MRRELILLLFACRGIAEERSSRSIAGLRGLQHPLYMAPSSDRTKPQRLVLDPQGFADVKSNAPSAGTYWYVVVSDASRTPGAFSFTATYDGPPDQLSLTLGETTATAVEPNKLRLELPPSTEPPPDFLLQITTKGPLKFQVFASRMSHAE